MNILENKIIKSIDLSVSGGAVLIRGRHLFEAQNLLEEIRYSLIKITALILKNKKQPIAKVEIIVGKTYMVKSGFSEICRC